MIRINLAAKPATPRYVLVARRLAVVLGRAPLEKPAARLDRRVMREVLCGRCGPGENWREACPQCGGYVDRLIRPALRKRLDEHGKLTKRRIKEATKARAANAR